MTYSKRKVKVKIHRTSDYDDKHTAIREFPSEKAMLEYGLPRVREVMIKKYTKDDEFMATSQKTRGIKFDYNIERYEP
jgi:hypothetical protein